MIRVYVLMIIADGGAGQLSIKTFFERSKAIEYIHDWKLTKNEYILQSTIFKNID